jgi:hypothetical protein
LKKSPEYPCHFAIHHSRLVRALCKRSTQLAVARECLLGGHGKYCVHFQLPSALTQPSNLQVFGNIVSGQHIAGLVYISQEATQSLTGFITSINFTTGHFFVDNVVECVLNDVRFL